MPKLLFRKQNQKPGVSAEKGLRAPKTVFRLSSRRARRLQVGMALGLSAGLLIAIVILSGSLSRYESRLADLFYRSRTPSGQVVLIAVDDRTVEDYGWPVERIVHRAFLFALMRAQPKVIAFNLLLPDPSPGMEDELFARIIERAERIVQPVLGIEATRFPPDLGTFPAFDSLLKPAPALRTPNTTLAHAMIYPDADGVVRRVPLAIDVPGQRYPALGLAALALYQGREPKIEFQDNRVVFGDKRVPLDEHGQMLINYVRHDAIKTISYSDIAQGRADYSLLRDKIVLVGPMTKAVPESYAVPLTVRDSRASNLEIQADLIETLLSGTFLREQDRLGLIGEVLTIAVIAGATLPHLPWLYAAALTLIYFALYLVYAFQRFDSGIVATPLYAALALLFTYTFAMLHRYFSEERTRARIARVFLGIVPRETMGQVLAHYERGGLSLSGGRREVTVLCANLRGLSTLSEALAPEAVIDIVNQYMARVIAVVFRYGGSIHSQAGNLIIAMWNLPLAQPDHARRAVNAAFEMQNALLNLNESRGESRIGVSVGIATGTAVAGYLSAAAREDYSVIGDVVTLAERLSVLAADQQVCIDPVTRAQIGGALETRPVHSIRTRGKKEPIQVWEVLAQAKLDARGAGT